ncbi:DinB family protein [Chitinophaga eiseniae]|uniref:DinB family protein n=1 Tax=Chitinophaga eiseniae TaxID=634771 RepID=A0A847SQC7_9BACT|nr:DinB family protein [Chitinophaga eiseniae]NLR82213.1 DinB family protein [Chitinophaga eiseniae]
MKAASNRMLGILAMYDLQTGLYPRALEGIADADAYKRLDTAANHIAWLAGSLVQQRFDVAGLIDPNVKEKSTGDALFAHNQGIKEGVTYPTLEVYQQDWERITPIFREVLAQATDERLDKIIEFPGMSFPCWDMVTFTIYREANCIGQIALWRRLLGYPAMKYM